MAKPPVPKIKERVKVQILPSSDAKEEVELDYRLLVLGNFTHSEPGLHKDGDGSLKSRRIREIKNKRDFKVIMEELNPKLRLMVPNKISGEEGAELEVDLDFKSMKDFHPDEIAQQIEPLQKLLKAREKLKQLKMQVLRDPKLRKAIEGVLREGADSIEALMSKLETAGESAQEPAQEPETKE
ncbi:MAG: type VI secretion system contractile sheath small subunit [Calditrichaeota bacterium]|nr:MAG: type VI secretion system contractile sheath small subunit [Calditrichota bacterium]